MSGPSWMLVAGVAGALQVVLLAHSARGGAAPLWLLRLALVVGALFGAARAGQLAAGVLGWLGGFALAGARQLRRWS